MDGSAKQALVFVSYSRADLMLVLRLARCLRAGGAQTWVDVENLQPGQSWKEAIREAIGAARLFVIVLSEKSLQSAWTSVEIDLALAHGLAILPVMIEDLDPARLPPALAERQILNVSDSPFAETAHLAARAILPQIGLTALPALKPPTSGHLWIEACPEGTNRASNKTWRKGLDHKATDPYMRLSLPLERLRLADLLETVANMTRASLLIPQEVRTEEATFLIAAIAGRLGPNRLQIITQARTGTAGDLAAFARLVGASHDILP